METSVAALPTLGDQPPRASSLIGRTFGNPLVDYLFVGGGITFPVFAVLYLFPKLNPVHGEIPYGVFIAINGAHFAASTVRLYTKPGARQEFPILSWGFPIVCLGLVGLGLYSPRVGGHIKALYFTWSPFHYAAQTYGLAVMYAMRSGARLDAGEKSQIWWVCLVPFLYAFFTANIGGLRWFISRQTVESIPLLTGSYQAIVWLLMMAVFLLPISLFWQLRRMRGKKVPLIVLLMQITNGLWWLGSDYLDAWFFTAVFHSIQYLIIVTDRHVADYVPREASGDRSRAAILHGTAFYGFSLLVGYVLFLIVPGAYAMLGFDGLQSYAMMTMVINLHHFVVDGCIWRTKPKTSPSGMSSALAASA
jgi:hypothetical protein